MWYSIWCYLKYFVFSTKIVSKENSFINRFKKEVLQSKIDNSFESEIQDLRNYYINQNVELANEDYGAGSRNKKTKAIINTRYLAKHVAISKKYGRVLFLLRKFLDAKNVLELGTSLGIGSCYLSAEKLTTIEGNKALFTYTSKTISEKFDKKIKFVNAQFDNVLEDLINHNDFDLIYIDGNHTFEATIKYFELLKEKKNLVIIFDDIYWNSKMTAAWKHIKNHKNVTLSIDLFKFGIVFLQDNIETKQNYILWY